jgi:hypothetical protein
MRTVADAMEWAITKEKYAITRWLASVSTA